MLAVGRLGCVPAHRCVSSRLFWWRDQLKASHWGFCGLYPMKHRVRKSPKECSSHREVYQLTRLGMATDRRDACVDGAQESQRRGRVPAPSTSRVSMKCPRRQHENHSGPRFCEEWGDRVHAHRLGTAAELLEAEVFERVRLDAVEAFERIRRHEKLAPEVAGRPFDGAVVFI